MTRSALSRRHFLAASVAIGAAPYFWTSAPAQTPSANDRLGIAGIGVGGKGSGDAHSAAKFGDMVACCDVDRAHAEKFAVRYKGRCQIYEDYRYVLDRKDVQVVIIGTPDHWHTPIAIAAMRAGKDVYCEKPLTLTIDEGKQIAKVVRETGQVFQVGTQQRSEYQQMFLKAVVLARSGRLGKNVNAICSIGGAKAGGPFENTAPPASLNWDLWLGQTPVVPYCEQRCHRTFRGFLEYSGGKLTDWGAHHLDIAQWALGYEDSGPIHIEGQGEMPVIPDDFDPVAFFAGQVRLPNSYNIALTFECKLTYANGRTMTVRHGPDNGIWLEGELGKIFVNRGKLTGKPIEDLTQKDQQWLDEEVRKLYHGREFLGHMANFFQCIKQRKQPISDVFTHHRSMTCCHLCNIALLLKRKLQWDPQKEDFVGDDQASQLLARPQRAAYKFGGRKSEVGSIG